MTVVDIVDLGDARPVRSGPVRPIAALCSLTLLVALVSLGVRLERPDPPDTSPAAAVSLRTALWRSFAGSFHFVSTVTTTFPTAGPSAAGEPAPVRSSGDVDLLAGSLRIVERVGGAAATEQRVVGNVYYKSIDPGLRATYGLAADARWVQVGVADPGAVVGSVTGDFDAIPIGMVSRTGRRYLVPPAAPTGPAVPGMATTTMIIDLDGSALVRRILVVQRMPGPTAGAVTVSTDVTISRIGEAVRVSPPPPDQTISEAEYQAAQRRAAPLAPGLGSGCPAEPMPAGSTCTSNVGFLRLSGGLRPASAERTEPAPPFGH